jgi:hypothetical protein
MRQKTMKNSLSFVLLMALLACVALGAGLGLQGCVSLPPLPLEFLSWCYTCAQYTLWGVGYDYFYCAESGTLWAVAYDAS